MMNWDGTATITRDDLENDPNRYKLYKDKEIVEWELRDGVFYVKWVDKC